MDLKLAGKTAIITGGSGGIGRGLVLGFAGEGCNVVVATRDAKKGQEVADACADLPGPVSVIATDVTDRAQVDATVAETLSLHGAIDVLVNNAGGLVQRVPVAELTDELFDQVLYLNVRSALMCIAAAVPHMRKSGGGNIINVTSVAARHGGGPGAVLYAGSKGFVSTMTRGLAKELVKDNIRVNAVAPGVIYTPFHERYSSPQMLEGFKATIPMNRIGTADECAGAFLFLASDQMSGYVTGQILEVNGGQYMP